MPSADWAALDTSNFNESITSEVHAIDGSTVVEIIIPSVSLAARLLRTWIVAHNERLQKAAVIWNGREFRGLSGREIQSLIDRMEKEQARGDTTD